MLQRSTFRCLLFAAFCLPVYAHIGSPDVYLDADAGPYRLFVTVRPPLVIPGVAELEVRSEISGVTEMEAVPLPMQGAGAKFAPVADKLTRSARDGQLFTGSLWMMAPGSWQVRLSANGDKGRGQIAVPVPSAALVVKGMRPGLGLLLSVLALFLTAAVIAMVGASVRESRLAPGVQPAPVRRRAARIAMLVAATIVVLVLWGGNRWWNAEAASYGEEVYKPIQMRAAIGQDGVLSLRLKDPGWLNAPGWETLFTRSVDDFVPDHNHLMHLYAIRQPGLDVVYHLHPEMSSSGLFRLVLPLMPEGSYSLYADVVHANGFPETLVSKIAVSKTSGRMLAGDDAAGQTTPWQASAPTNRFTLPDGYRMEWVDEPAMLSAKTPALFRFRLLRPDGAAPQDMTFYMGMLGHAAFVKTDGSAFAHIHPSGSVSMAALMMAQSGSDMTGIDMSGMNHEHKGLPNEVAFPYGFPAAGRYRIFVQMKHGTTVETASFDALSH